MLHYFHGRRCLIGKISANGRDMGVLFHLLLKRMRLWD